MNPLFFKIGKVVFPPVGWLFCAPRGHGKVAWIETSNKLRIIETVEFAHKAVGGNLTLAQQVEKVYAADPFPALWLAEGTGLHYGLTAIKQTESPEDLLTERMAQKVPEKILLMLHAGMSMAIVRHFMDKLGRDPAPASVRAAVKKIVSLLRANSRQGYLGIAFEPFGMATRFFYGLKTFAEVLRALAEFEPTFVPHFWHGAGRALYFVNFLATPGEPWPSFRLIAKEAQDDLSRHNLLAGLAAGMMMVNMQTPYVMENIIRHRVSKLSAEDEDAFSNGIFCATIMRYDTTPNDRYIKAYPEHVPSADVAQLWNALVKTPVRNALDRYHTVLAKNHCLDLVCSYCQIDSLIKQMEKQAGG